MAADFSPYVNLRIYDKQPSEIYLNAIEIAQMVMPDFQLRQGTIEDGMFQAMAYMTSVAVTHINALPNKLMEGVLSMMGFERLSGGRASVSARVQLLSYDGEFIPSGTIFSHAVVAFSESLTTYYETINSTIMPSVTEKLATITNVTSDGTTVTYTATNDLEAGDVVTITGITPSAFNLSFASVATASGSGFTVTNGATGSYSSGGLTVTERPYVDIPCVAREVGISASAADGDEFLLTDFSASIGTVFALGNFVQGSVSESDSEYLIRGASFLRSLSENFVTASQMGQYIRTTYLNVSRALVYDLTDSDANSDTTAADVPGTVSIYLYGNGDFLNFTEKNIIHRDIVAKSHVGLVVRMSDARVVYPTISVTIYINSTFRQDTTELAVDYALTNGINLLTYSVASGLIRYNDVLSMLSSISGVDYVSDLVLGGSNMTLLDNGDLEFEDKGDIPSVITANISLTTILNYGM